MTQQHLGSDCPRNRTDWAWEFLRRNDAFRATARRREPVATIFFDDGLTRFQPTLRAPRAEARGFASFSAYRSYDDRDVGRGMRLGILTAPRTSKDGEGKALFRSARQARQNLRVTA